MNFLLLVIGLTIAFSSFAKPLDLRLMCTIQKSSDGTAQLATPRPKDQITVTTSANGDASITSTLHGKELIGRITEHEILGTWNGPDSIEEIYINRYTTEYRYSTSFNESDRSPLAAYGSCQTTGKPAP